MIPVILAYGVIYIGIVSTLQHIPVVESNGSNESKAQSVNDSQQ